MSTPDLAALLPSGLTQPEMEFVWNLEGLGLPGKKAAALAGVPYGWLCRPVIVQARQMLQDAIRGTQAFTREDVMHGIHEAIGRAKLLGDPATEILGWDKLARVGGLDAPQRVDVNVHASIDVLKSHVRRLSDAELTKYIGAGGIIDADFYEVERGKEASQA